MKTKKQMKIQKPTKIDASFLYNCPNCQAQHWLYLREAQTKNFKIVCECDTIFKPKLIHNIKISYAANKEKKHKKTKSTNTPPIPAKSPDNVRGVPLDFMESCVKILDGYGFTKMESINLISKAYHSTEDKRIVNVIKIALSSLEIKDV